jgi:hypothetical protein
VSPKSEVGRRKAKVFCALALAFAPLAGFAQSFVVPAELWDRPRSGAAVLAQPAVRQAVERCLAAEGSRLLVRHAARLDAQLAAEELRSFILEVLRD